jgi:hypothetical protein
VRTWSQRFKFRLRDAQVCRGPEGRRFRSADCIMTANIDPKGHIKTMAQGAGCDATHHPSNLLPRLNPWTTGPAKRTMFCISCNSFRYPHFKVAGDFRSQWSPLCSVASAALAIEQRYEFMTWDAGCGYLAAVRGAELLVGRGSGCFARADHSSAAEQRGLRAESLAKTIGLPEPQPQDVPSEYCTEKVQCKFLLHP